MRFCSCTYSVDGFSPSLASNKNNLPVIKTDLVTIEVNHYLGRHIKQIRTTVTASEAEEIQFYLTELFKAQERSDYQAISKYESLLLKKGIFEQQYQKIFSTNAAQSLLETIHCPLPIISTAGENISNRLCYFNAIGEGIVLWWLGLQNLEGIVKILKNASNFFEAFILLLIFLPFLVMTLVFSNLIPFRILASTEALALKNGTISCLGLNSFQRRMVGAGSFGVNLSWFTGITINFLPSNNRTAFLFVSGMALKTEGMSGYNHPIARFIGKKGIRPQRNFYTD